MHPALRSVHAHAFHGREIRDDPAVTGGMPGRVMAATAHGNGEVMRAGKVDGVEHIGHPGAPCDEGGMLVDHPIPHLAGLLIRRVLGTHQRPVQTRFEGGHGCRIQLDIGPSQGGSAQRTHRLSFLRGHNG